MNNTPIEDLVKEYDEEATKMPLFLQALRYVETMEDSHVRVILFKLANIVKENNENTRAN